MTWKIKMKGYWDFNGLFPKYNKPKTWKISANAIKNYHPIVTRK